MSRNEEKNNNNNKEFDLDESNKTEEDLLGYSSKYKTNVYKEEDMKENEAIPRDAGKRLSVDSTSISQEYSGISGSNSKKINLLPSKNYVTHRSIGFPESSNKFIEYQEKQRKMSSPLCFYYDGSDAYLSKILKNIIDMNKTQNFIKKENFFYNCDNINNNNFIKDNLINDNHLNINLLYKNQNFQLNNNNENENIERNNEFKRLSNYFNKFPYNNINNYNYNRINNNNIINNNNFFFNNNNYQQQIYNINFINLNNFSNNQMNPVNNINRRKLTYNFEDGIIGNYFNNILNLNNNMNISQAQQKLNSILFSYNEEQGNFNKNDNKKTSNNKPNNSNKDKKPFDKRKGDWLCPKCNNLNFSFRMACNRCEIPKPSNLDEAKGQ